MEYTLDALLSLNNNEILSFKGKNLEITTCDEKVICGVVTGFGLATNSPHLVCSIEVNGCGIYIQKIKKLVVLS